jgi:hypothetical protein
LLGLGVDFRQEGNRPEAVNADAQFEGTMLEIYPGRRGSTVTVADPAASSARYQEELMEGRTGWFQVCHSDGAITLAPIGLDPLTFETEGSVDCESVIPPRTRADDTPDRLDAVARMD